MTTMRTDRTMPKRCLLLAVALMICIPLAGAKPLHRLDAHGARRVSLHAPPLLRVFIAGDSTSAVYAPDRYPQLGWGMVLKCAFSNDVVVYDYAKGGRSTKSFIAQGLLDEMAAQFAKGDTLLIAFGHNDERADDPARFTDPDGDFRTYLMQFVSTARAKGVVPVLLTPVTRRTVENGQAVDTHAPYARAVRDVAVQENVPLIDLDADSMAWLGRIGPEEAKKYFLYVPGGTYLRYTDAVSDDTHSTELGARAIADLVAGRLATLPIPIAARVMPIRPALTRPVPVGSASCE
jgi:lysophospholipase L1-like esterase